MRHARRSVVVLAAAALLGMGALVSAPAAAAAPFPPSDVELEVYEGTVDATGVEELRSLGLDAQDFVTEPAPEGGAEVEVVTTPDEATKLQAAGVEIEVKRGRGNGRVGGACAQARAGWDAFRPYSEHRRRHPGRDVRGGRRSTTTSPRSSTSARACSGRTSSRCG